MCIYNVHLKFKGKYKCLFLPNYLGLRAGNLMYPDHKSVHVICIHIFAHKLYANCLLMKVPYCKIVLFYRSICIKFISLVPFKNIIPIWRLRDVDFLLAKLHTWIVLKTEKIEMVAKNTQKKTIQSTIHYLMMIIKTTLDEKIYRTQNIIIIFQCHVKLQNYAQK